MARRRSLLAVDEQVEARRETGAYLLRSKHLRPACREFERERQPLQIAAQRTDGLHVGGIETKVRLKGLRSVHKQLHAGARGQTFRRFRWRRDWEWTNGALVLP